LKISNFITVVFQTLALVLALAVLFPSVVKLNHAFTHHSHHVCDNDNTLDTHFHETDLDCDFYKFKLTTQFYFQNRLVILSSPEENFKISESQYAFISDFQRLQTALRGPPQLT